MAKGYTLDRYHRAGRSAQFFYRGFLLARDKHRGKTFYHIGYPPNDDGSFRGFDMAKSLTAAKRRVDEEISDPFSLSRFYRHEAPTYRDEKGPIKNRRHKKARY